MLHPINSFTRKLWKAWIIVIFNILCYNGLAQNPSFSNYTTQDGLPSNTIYEIKSDKDGFLWIATDSGIAKYDGYKFQTFDKTDGLTDNEIFGFFTDSKNRMWLRTFNGTFCYYQNGIIYNSSNIEFKNKVFLKGIIKEITEDKEGNLYFSSTNKQVLKLDSDLHFTEQETGTHPISLLRDKDHNVIIAIREKGYKFSYFDFLKNKKIAFDIENIDTNMYHTLSDLGLESRNKYISHHYNIDVDNGNPYSIIKHRNLYWYYSPNLPLLYAKKINSKLIKKNDFKNITANKALVDLEGNLWFCTLSNGLYKLNHQIESKFNIRSISRKDKLTVMSAYNNALLLGTSSGLIYQLKNNKAELIIETKAPKIEYGQYNLNVIKIINTTSDDFYVGIDYGIFKYNKDYKVEKSHILNVKDINTYKDGLLVSTYNGIYSLSESNFERRNHIYTERCTSNFIDSDGNLWFGTNKGCVMYYPNEINFWSPKDSLLNTITVNDINETNDGHIVIATNGDGLLILDKEGNLRNKINTINGLSHDIINHILIHDEDIWLSTNYGVSRVTRNLNTTFEIRNYKQNIGLVSNAVLQTIIVDDYLHVLTPESLTSIKISKLDNMVSRAPNIHLDNIYINGKITPKSKLQNLHYYENELEVHYTSMSINNPDEIEFQYRLEGASDNWKTTKDRKVKFEGLSAKRYELQIKATMPGQNVENPNAIITLPISLSPIWYRNNWIRALILISLLIFLSYLFSARLRKQKVQLEQELAIAQLKQKALMMEMNPHFINNCLSSIQNYVLTGDRREASSYLSKFAKLIRVIISDSRNSKVALNQEIEHLELYLDLEKLRFSNQFEYTIEANIKGKDNIFIPTMMIQPLVENVIMHAFDFANKENKQLDIKFSRINDYIKCTVIDNGIGLSKSSSTKKESSSGIALENIKKRIKHLAKNYPESKFEISEYRNNKESGTKATLISPISKQDNP